MARMGMDVDQVEAAGRQLKTHAGKIDALIKEINGVVTRLPSVWDGPDAQRFVNDWWPKHRQSLVDAQHQIGGLGQSALNNSNEQRRVSSVSGGAVSSGGSNGANGSHGSNGAATAGNGAAANAGGSAQAQAAANFVAQRGGSVINFDKAYGAQCFDVFQQYTADHAGGPNGARAGTDAASDLFNRYGQPGNTVANYYDRIPVGQAQMQLGDVIVYSGGYGGFGHVAVVTAVGDNGNYSVIEQNYTGYNGPVDKNHGPSDPAIVRNHNVGEKSPRSAPLTILGYLRPKNPTA